MAVADCMRDVNISINAAFNKLHVVLSQGAGLIGENILHLREDDTAAGRVMSQTGLSDTHGNKGLL